MKFISVIILLCLSCNWPAQQLVPVIADTVTIVDIGGNNLVISHTGESKADIIFNIDNDSIGVVIRNDSIIEQWSGKRPISK